MKNKVLKAICILICIIIPTSLSNTKAYNNGIEDFDLISYGYHLVVNGATIDHFDEDAPISILFREENINPIGLYTRMIGMKIDVPMDFTVPPEEGFEASDPEYGGLAGRVLYYSNVEVYDVEAEEPTSSNPINWNIMAVIFGILGVAIVIVIVYGIYRYAPKLLAKRCSVCKKAAIGQCKKCAKVYCNTCYTNGCPNCKGRTLIRFKK